MLPSPQSNSFSNPSPPDSTQWLDFYSILGVAPGADEATLRARIGEAYVEAMRNADHRQVERRMHFQVMCHRIIPQARRILLEERTRRAYDQQLERHLRGDSGAIPYTTFVTQLKSIEAGDNPFPTSVLPAMQEDGETIGLATQIASEDTQNLLDSAHQVLMTEQKFADMAPIPTLGEETSTHKDHGFFVIDPDLDNAPASQPIQLPNSEEIDWEDDGALSIADISLVDESDAVNKVESGPDLTSGYLLGGDEIASPIPERTQMASRQSRSAPTPVSAPPTLTPPTSTLSASGLPSSSAASDIEKKVEAESPQVPAPQIQAPVAQAPVARAGFSQIPEETQVPPGEVRAQVLRADGLPVNNHSTADRSADLGLNELDASIRGVVTSHRTDIKKAESRFTTRVDVGEVNVRAANARRLQQGKRSFPKPILFAIAGIAVLSVAYFAQSRWRAAAVTGQTLRIVYASTLQPVMDSVEKNFQKTSEGTGVKIEMRPSDARDAMQIALLTNIRGEKNKENLGSDIWIPSESMWSERFNTAAAKQGQRPLMAARSVALTPLVLMVRSDRAAALRRRFPNRIVSTWDALREAVARDARGHFGLTDPEKSGSGALARYFMAREWSQKNRVAWDAKTAKDTRLWLWMNDLENNVPSYARLTSEMAKDLALGNGDRYWWAVVYESDALNWMKRSQDVEVFYLPQTAYADHPLCIPDQSQMTAKGRQTRDAFERYMRSPSTQKLLLENGFRPTEISISEVSNNVFVRSDFKKRGVRVSGFRVDERINYRILDALTAQWQQRF